VSLDFEHVSNRASQLIFCHLRLALVYLERVILIFDSCIYGVVTVLVIIDGSVEDFIRRDY
jgi:hypothetical protein